MRDVDMFVLCARLDGDRPETARTSEFEIPRDLAQAARKMETEPVPRLRLRVTATAETIIRSGHPWLFADSIREQNRAGRLGELAVIFDRHDKFLAIGLFDPESPIRVRVLHTGKPATIDSAWWRGRLKQTLARRAGLFDAQTNGYRCIHGESDGWPGLVLDRYDRTFVLKLYTAAWLPRLEEVVGSIRAALHPHRLVLRLSRNIQSSAKEHGQYDDGQLLFGERLDGPLTFLESGLRFEADVLQGQKSGFFLDQRENRRRLLTGQIAAGFPLTSHAIQSPEVLNTFAYTCAFSVCAAKAGVDMLTRVLAIEWGSDGIRVNSVMPGPIEDTEGMKRLAPTPDAMQTIVRGVPLGRMGTKQDVANLVLFLASPWAAFISGAVIPVDGGWSVNGASGIASILRP